GALGWEGLDSSGRRRPDPTNRVTTKSRISYHEGTKGLKEADRALTLFREEPVNPVSAWETGFLGRQKPGFPGRNRVGKPKGLEEADRALSPFPVFSLCPLCLCGEQRRVRSLRHAAFNRSGDVGAVPVDGGRLWRLRSANGEWNDVPEGP